MTTPFLGNAVTTAPQDLCFDSRFYDAANRPPLNKREPMYDEHGFPIPGTEGVKVPLIKDAQTELFELGVADGEKLAREDIRAHRRRNPDNYLPDPKAGKSYLLGFNWGYEHALCDAGKRRSPILTLRRLSKYVGIPGRHIVSTPLVERHAIS